jgi:putative transposase
VAISRQSKFDAPGTFHNVIVRGIEKEKIVSGKKDQQNFVPRVGKLASESGTVIYA